MADITVDDVAAWVGLPVPMAEGPKRDLMQRVVDGVVAHFQSHYVDPSTLTVPEPDDDYRLAETMTAARYWHRPASPNGVIDFGDLGPIRVTRVDHDVERLVSRRWGFA